MSALRSLLADSIDYAGLFPPATLPMREAVANYAAYRSGSAAWMLGRFVVPVPRIEEFEEAAAEFLPQSGRAPWRLSALITDVDIDRDAARIIAFNARHAKRAGDGAAVVEAVELKTSSVLDVSRIGHALADSFVVYVEVPTAGDPTDLIDALLAHGLRAKIRTGGITAGAVPAPLEVLRFVAACLERGVPFKATAGLHHPLRGEYPLTYEPGAESGTMYGFLNVFLAAAFLRAGLPVPDVANLLLEREASAFTFDEDGVAWRDTRIATGALEAARAHGMTAVGSCSFEEPLAELAALRLL
jgi:hypothetical protein